MPGPEQETGALEGQRGDAFTVGARLAGDARTSVYWLQLTAVGRDLVETGVGRKKQGVTGGIDRQTGDVGRAPSFDEPRLGGDRRGDMRGRTATRDDGRGDECAQTRADQERLLSTSILPLELRLANDRFCPSES